MKSSQGICNVHSIGKYHVLLLPMFDRHGWYFGKNFREEGQKLLQEREMFDVSTDRISSYQEKECKEIFL